MRKVVYLFSITLTCLVGLIACDDYLTMSSDMVAEELGVSVTVPIGFDKLTDGNVYTPKTRGSSEAFTVEQGSVRTRGTATDDALKPDKLYYLEVQQYDQTGKLLQNNIMSEKGLSEITPGSNLTLTLTPTSGADYCQLLIVARGSTQVLPTLKGKSFGDVQDMTISASNINSIANTVEGIKQMPYMLHLSKVKIVQDNKGDYVIQSPDGVHDVRLLLQRLAARLTVMWHYQVSGYNLKSLLLQSMPMNYTVVDKPDTDGTYPSLVSQFTTLPVDIISNDGTNNSYSCWVPANVRGESAAATTETQRTKANAPMGSTFFNFVAVNTTNGKKKLDYRVYIGSGPSTDFNMYRNKDYVFAVNFAHVGIPTGDNRVTYIDPIPASENNDNLVPTANCFMVEPGGSFCFDPFAFQQNGTEITNSQMTGWYGTAGTGIKSVRLLWQTRENGDVGDPVMGIANSDDDHTNIVDIKRTIDNSDINAVPANDKGQCRIYCRVAANTTGGNGVIAAYDGPDGTGNIVWSWHVWVTDYKPDTRGGEQVLEPVNKRKLLFSLNNASVLPMMDRNLGAMAGYVDEVPTSFVEMSKTNGFHYQWGRKDPFPSNYTTKNISKIDNKNSTTPPEGMLNRYGADGIKYVVNGGQSGTISLQESCRQPLVFYASGGQGPAWTNVSNSSFAGWDGSVKPVWDPCPAGWRVVSRTDLSAVYQDGGGFPNKNMKNFDTRVADSGYLLYFQQLSGGHTSYFRFTGYGRYMNTFELIGTLCTIWTRTKGDDTAYRAYAGWFNTETTYGVMNKHQSDAHPLRCVQEKAD